MKKKNVYIGTAVTLTAVASSSVALAYDYGKKVLYREHLSKMEQENWYEELGAQRIQIKNHKGLYLSGYLIEKENADKTIICLHGLMESAYHLIKTVHYLQSIIDNANILMVDSSAHGLSDGYIRGLGYRDITDLIFFNSYVVSKYGDDHSIIMYGHGVGANTILNTSSLDKLKNVKLIISEGAYDNGYTYLSKRCQRDTKINATICGPVVRQVIKKEMNIDIRKLDTKTFVKKNTIPTIYVHSKDDKEVSFRSVFSLYNNNASQKMLLPLKEDHLYELEGKDNDYSLSINEFINTEVI
ncbi:MAG: hypothetical protein LUF02_03650 [Erysipelotrichaceae bacterium]|nr:hypothetical protein [Erysipelotrichaceae bacterium]